jgi:hypothetical protein
MYTKIGTYCSFLDDCLLSLLDLNIQSNQNTRAISTNFCAHTVVPPDDGPRYGRNMQRLMKYTKNKLCIKLAFLYTIISRCTDNKTKHLSLDGLRLNKAHTWDMALEGRKF